MSVRIKQIQNRNRKLTLIAIIYNSFRNNAGSIWCVFLYIYINVFVLLYGNCYYYIFCFNIYFFCFLLNILLVILGNMIKYLDRNRYILSFADLFNISLFWKVFKPPLFNRLNRKSLIHVAFIKSIL